MASVIESRHYPSTLALHRARLAMVAAALLFMACSRGSGDQPGTGADRATTASPPTTVSAPAADNGGLVFSRVVMPSADGVPLAAEILELSDDGSVGRVLAEGAALPVLTVMVARWPCVRLRRRSRDQGVAAIR